MQSTDTTFGEKLRQQLKTHECFGYDPRIPSLDFTVRHYAGDVLYSCDKFLDKNRDSLSPGKHLFKNTLIWDTSSVHASQRHGLYMLLPRDCKVLPITDGAQSPY